MASVFHTHTHTHHAHTTLSLSDFLSLSLSLSHTLTHTHTHTRTHTGILGVQCAPEVARKEREAHADPAVEQGESNHYAQQHPSTLLLLEIRQRHFGEELELHVNGIPVDSAFILDARLLGRQLGVELRPEPQEWPSAGARLWRLPAQSPSSRSAGNTGSHCAA